VRDLYTRKKESDNYYNDIFHIFPYNYSCCVYCDIFAVQFQYLKLRALQRQSYTHYFYEATVGAGLPIISTLRGLLETGDKILRIEGIFRFCYVVSIFPLFLRLLDFEGGDSM
jgi:hypothetical protein